MIESRRGKANSIWKGRVLNILKYILKQFQKDMELGGFLARLEKCGNSISGGFPDMLMCIRYGEIPHVKSVYV